MTNLILCGGVGSRLWPLSRKHLPKQFARIIDGQSLFENTVQRNRSFVDDFFIASNEDQSFLAGNQLHELGIERWKSLVEPVGRNTCPAISLAVMALDAEELVLVSPSDHMITDVEAYRRAIERAQVLAQQGKLVTFGIKPEYPETGFGYIQEDPKKPGDVISFKEKPDLETAREYVRQGNYYWNGGIFCFKAGVYLDELLRLSPAVYQACKSAFETSDSREHVRPNLETMSAIPGISIDYAIMEKTDKVAVVACDIGWSDLGSFDALYDYLKGSSKTIDQNVLACKVEPVLIDSQRNLVINGERMVSLVGVEDLVVVETPDALLVAKRGMTQKVKNVVDELSKRKSELIDTFPTVERPWGRYTILHAEEGHKVRRVEIKPGHRISLQRHRHRNEHLVVVSGVAHVLIEDVQHRIANGESIAIPIGKTHRITNDEKSLLTIIETIVGDRLSEDDVERLSDDYAK